MTTFVRSSRVCRRCGFELRPEELRDATRTEVEGTDGSWGLQFDHGGDCPNVVADRRNDAHPRFIQQHPKGATHG